MNKQWWVKAGRFGWISTKDKGYQFDDIQEDPQGRDEVIFFYNVGDKQWGPYRSNIVSGGQPG